MLRHLAERLRVLFDDPGLVVLEPRNRIQTIRHALGDGQAALRLPEIAVGIGNAGGLAVT